MVSEHQLIVLIERLEHKLDLLKGLYTDVRSQVEQLERDNNHLQEQVRELQKKADETKKNTAISKDSGIIVKDNLSDTDTNVKLKQQLDEYIRDIERCITHLSSLS